VPSPGAHASSPVRAAELVAALSLATDLALGVELEHGLRSTLFALRLADRLGVGADVAADAYYACLLLHVGCTADVHVVAATFGEGADLLSSNLLPVLFGSRRETLGALAASVAPDRPLPVRAPAVARALARSGREYPGVAAANCEVARMLTARLGLPARLAGVFAYLQERWDGRGMPGRARGEQIPVALRIAHVARDADAQRLRGGAAHAARVARERAGRAFDPAIAACLADHAGTILELAPGESAWDSVLEGEPAGCRALEGAAIDDALAAIGDFADLASPYLTGHSAAVADLAAAAATRRAFDPAATLALRRSALVHDVGRVAVPVRIWQKPGPLSPQEREQVRLHAYHSERTFSHSPFLAALAPVAGAHHERLDGSGYHRGATAAALTPPARVLAAADAYHAMTQPRPHRAALAPERAAETLADDARAGRLDPDAVGAVLAAAGQPRPAMERPAALTEREAEVIGLLARGLLTKQVAAALGISPKTADRHVQNAYAKIGVSTRAGAALFAMEHGLVAWGELPMGGSPSLP
jgi:HD-GYP domain-containing protein (c-di-GMP phosphodiesterase class II)